jgi:FkbM family methyltransferase
MQSKIGRYCVKYFNKEEFHSLKREIFTNDSYYFESTNINPLIIDVGAYIGLSVLYFKNLYPKSQIVAFEPNPEAFELLEENIFQNSIEGVELHKSAAWTKDGKKDMYIDDTGMHRYSVASFKKDAWNGEVLSKKINVKTEELGKYTNRETDLLKLDVEGSEQQILKSLVPYFENIKNIIVEFHPTRTQNVETVLNMLKRNYAIEIYQEGKEIERNIPKDKLLTIRAIYRR